VTRHTCSGCGCPHDRYTKGCKPCINRRCYRNRRNTAGRSPLCRGCECPLAEYTDGCRTCTKRRSKQNLKAGIRHQDHHVYSTAYSTRHARMRKVRGPSQNHLCVRHAERGAEVQAVNWATVHGENGMDPWADYVPLCQACHNHYDRDLRGDRAGRVRAADGRFL